MREVVQVSVDHHGRIVIPSAFRKRLGLSQGMTLLVEVGQSDELCLRVQDSSPMLIDKQGILVIKAQSDTDLTDVIRDERERRIVNLQQQAGL